MTPDTLVHAQPDTAGVRVPPDLSAFCRPGVAELRPQAAPAPAPDGPPVAATTVYSTGNGAVGQPVRCVVRSAEEWAALWAAVTRTIVSPQPLPAVGFGSQMLLVAGMGIRPSTGYSIEILGVRRTPDGVGATVVHHLPGDGCTVGMAETEPVHVVAVPRHDGAVRFVETIRYAPPCTE